MKLLLSTTVLSGLLAGLASAATIPSAKGPATSRWADVVVHERVKAAALDRWTYVAPAPDSAQVHLSVALKQPGLGQLKRMVDAFSDPSHEKYGAHLTQEQLSSLREAPADYVATVQSWLAGAGITHRYDGRDVRVRFTTTVAQANRLLACKLATYRDEETGREVVRAEEYSLPRKVADVVDFVYPLTQFLNAPRKFEAVEMPSQELKKRQSTWPKSCAQYITPDCLAELYNINYVVPDNFSPVEFAVAGFLEEFPAQDALNTFLADYSPRRNESGFEPEYNITLEMANGPVKTRPGAGVEAQLDVQYSMPFIQPMNVTFISTAGRGPDLSGPNRTQLPDDKSGNEPWAEFLEHLLARPSPPPHVVSISYTDDEQVIPEAYARRVCDLFMQVAARGVSVLVATGDGGAAGVGGSACKANDGSGRDKFLAAFPVDCPYVTAVGATSAYAPAEPAWFSTGGFSEYFGRPAWQDAAVRGYLDKINGSHAGWYAPGGRAYPDLSAVGSRFLMQKPAAGSRPWTQKGTSASTPVVAALVALANDKRMRQGKPALGFLNPLLYSGALAGAFNDVTSGVSGSCSSAEVVEPGWAALEGWDPATGLGTLDFARFIQALGSI